MASRLSILWYNSKDKYIFYDVMRETSPAQDLPAIVVIPSNQSGGTARSNVSSNTGKTMIRRGTEDHVVEGRRVCIDIWEPPGGGPFSKHVVWLAFHVVTWPLHERGIDVVVRSVWKTRAKVFALAFEAVVLNPYIYIYRLPFSIFTRMFCASSKCCR